MATWDPWVALNDTHWSVTAEWHLSIYFSFLSSSYFIILTIGMTNTTSQYYFAHADLHFPADNPHVKFSQWMFLPTGSLQQPLSSAVSCTPIPNCSSWRAPETPKTPARGNWLFPCGFQTLFFQVGLLVSLERGSERDSGGQGGKGWGEGGRAGMCRTHLSPDTGREKQQNPGQQMNSALHFCEFAVNPRSVNWFL